MEKEIQCPFVYADGRKCTGHVKTIKAFRGDFEWAFDDNRWSFEAGPNSHYHLYCSEKNTHSGFTEEDALKFWWDELPEELQRITSAHNGILVSG